MKKILPILLCLAVVSAVAQTSDTQPQQQPGKKIPLAQVTPEPVLPYSPSLNVESMDKSVDPCVDFYQYSCGGWKQKNPIPSDQVSWGVYSKLYQDNLKFLRGILEEAASGKGERDAITEKIGAFYAACMDEPAIEQPGFKPIQPQLAAIAQLKSTRELAPLVADQTGPGERIVLVGGDQMPGEDCELAGPCP